MQRPAFIRHDSDSGDSTRTTASVDSNPDRPLLPRSNLSNEVQVEILHTNPLPPPLSQKSRMDGSWASVKFVIMATILELLVWGPTFSFGAWQEYYTSAESPFSESPSGLISAIGTSCLALNYSMILGGVMILRRYPNRIREIFWSNLAIYSLSFLLASFATEVWQLILLQGVIAGVAGGLVYAPIYVLLGEWFKEKKSLAGGIIFSGSAAGGFIFPPIISILTTKVGFSWTLRIFALIVSVIGSIVVYNIERNESVLVEESGLLLEDAFSAESEMTLPLRESQLNSPIQKFKEEIKGSSFAIPNHWNFFRNGLFYIVLIIIMCQGFFYSSLAFYLPTFVARFSTSINAGWTLSAMNAFSILSQTIMGWACDKYGYRKATLASGLFSIIGVLSIFRGTSTLPRAIGFAIFNGFFSGGFASIWFSAATEIAEGSIQSSSLIFGLIAIARGIAAIIGPALVGSVIGLETSTMFGFQEFTIIITIVMVIGTVISLGLVLVEFWHFETKSINYEKTAILEA